MTESEEVDDGGSVEDTSTLLKKRKGRPPKMAKTTKTTSAEGGAYFSSPTALQRFSSGSTLLDCVLGGGWALGRVSNLVGDRSTGKTLLAIEASANFLHQFPDGKVVYIETEAAFDLPHAKSLGLPIEKVEFPNDNPENDPIDTIEKLFDKMESLLDTSKVETLVIVDSLDALSDDAEMDRGIADGNFGASKAKKLSELFRRLNQKMSKQKFAVIIVSQIRDNIGAMFGKKHTRSGGKALDFYASQIVWLANMGRIARTKNKVPRVVGVKVKAKCEKNKVGLPFRECQFPIYFNFGVEDVLANLEFLEGLDVDSLEGSKIADIIAKLDSLTPEEYKALRAASNAAVIAAWNAIEDGFLTGRKKY